MVIKLGLIIEGKDYRGNIRTGKIIKVLKGFKKVIIQCSDDKYDTCHICFNDIINNLD